MIDMTLYAQGIIFSYMCISNTLLSFLFFICFFTLILPNDKHVAHLNQNLVCLYSYSSEYIFINFVTGQVDLVRRFPWNFRSLSTYFDCTLTISFGPSTILSQVVWFTWTTCMTTLSLLQKKISKYKLKLNQHWMTHTPDKIFSVHSSKNKFQFYISLYHRISSAKLAF